MKVDAEIVWVEAVELPKPSLLNRLVGVVTGQDSTELVFDDDDPWIATRALYIYVDDETDDIVYVGKAWSTTVIDRYLAQDKERLWERLETDHGIHRDDLRVHVGLVEARRLTKELLADIERLLIYQIDPVGNIASTTGGRCRPGLTVRCSEDWPLRRRTFIDE